MRGWNRRLVTSALAVLTVLGHAAAVDAQIFHRPPCPPSISTGVLGYNGFIDKDGIAFPVASLYHLTPGKSDVIYRPVPERPQTGTKAWEMAAVGAMCYWWMSPVGAWLIVQETVKYGYVRDLDELACGDGGGSTELVEYVSDSPYDSEYDPFDAGGGCGSSGGGGDRSSTGGGNCRQEWVVVEISYDNGATWHTYWEGYATICE